MSARGNAGFMLPGLIALSPLLLCVSLFAQDGPLDRTVLPIPEPNYRHITELDARNAKAPPRFEVKVPANVVVPAPDFPRVDPPRLCRAAFPALARSSPLRFGR